jgi:outer membrane protein insertion porin family
MRTFARRLLPYLLCLLTIPGICQTTPPVERIPVPPAQQTPGPPPTSEPRPSVEQPPAPPSAQTPAPPAEQVPPASAPATPPVAPSPEVIAPVQQIQFTGNTALTSDELTKISGITPDEPLNAKMLADAIGRIQGAYTERGYIADFVYYEILGEQSPRTLIFHIREVHVQEVQITGLKVTHEDVVRRFIPIRPGDLYNQNAIREAVTRLTNLNIFDDIQVFLREGSAPGQVILVFDVKEAKVQRLDFGGTYDPAGRLVLTIGYVNANFRGRAEQVSANANIGTIAGNVGGNLTYYNPAAPTPDRTVLMRGFTDVVIRFSNDLTNTPGSDLYFERHTGFQGLWTHYLQPNRQLAFGFRYEGITSENFPQQDFVPNDLPSDNGWVAIPSLRYVLDNRVSMVFPVSGTYTYGLLEAGYSGPKTGPSGLIARLQGDQRWLHPLQRITPEMLTSDTARPPRSYVIRLSGGIAPGPLPFYEQFFLGGVDDLRGYLQSRFWGKYFVLLNNEYRVPITRAIVGLAFVDVGDAWGSNFQIVPGVPTDFAQQRNFVLRVGYGVGAWYYNPALGFVRVILGHGDTWRTGLAIGQPF